MSKKTLQELTIKDNFMFGAVMCDEDNCTPLLEMILGISIRHLEVSKEKSIFYHPEYRGIRLDIFANDENHTHYNVEMQISKKPALGKRSRYYHSQVDMELLEKGSSYENLPNAFVIFICDFDPFEEKRYCYTFENRCVEDGRLRLEDGCQALFLSTRGENRHETPASLIKFLEFVAADLEESERDFEDSFVRQLQDSVSHIKKDREMGERYMTLEELICDEREESRQEGLQEGMLNTRKNTIFEFLERLGTIPEGLRDKINALNQEEDLKYLVQKAARVDSFETFEQEVLRFYQR